MKQLVHSFLDRIAGWFPSRRASLRSSLSDPLPRAELLGMYFTDANKKESRHASASVTRERRDGKFSQNRRRG